LKQDADAVIGTWENSESATAAVDPILVAVDPILVAVDPILVAVEALMEAELSLFEMSKTQTETDASRG